VEACNTLLSRDLKRNLFKLFASWSGANYAKPLGFSGSAIATNNIDEEKLQFNALQVTYQLDMKSKITL
jgi:hypothetical protein